MPALDDTRAHQQGFGRRTQDDSRGNLGEPNLDAAGAGKEFAACERGASGDGIVDGDEVYETAVFVG
jgi:hypothetical protein